VGGRQWAVDGRLKIEIKTNLGIERGKRGKRKGQRVKGSKGQRHKD